jgi:hypothetical protein
MPKSLSCLLAGLLLASAPALAQEGSTASPGLIISLRTSIHIDDAQLGSASPGCDVSQEIKQRCEGRTHCEIVVSKDLCPTKRLPGLVQPLRISYHCRVGEMPRNLIADEPDRLRLLCASNPSRKD